ncbi:hypothetical protein [Streptomyces sp. NPDC059398]|uniref:hypothetical protein n=1 Tax=Streptomyces sp. NPDC059398 TaxID=3346820 RepID=UPI0036976DB5
MKTNTVSRGAAVALAAAMVLFGGVAARADDPGTDPAGPGPTCPELSVCFIKDGAIVAEYHEVTPWESLPAPLAGPLQVVNNRPWTAWIGDTKGGAECLRPDSVNDIYLTTIDSVRVTESDGCAIV